MAKIKVSDLAVELGCEAKELLAFLQEKGIEAKRSNSSIDETDADVARGRFSKGNSETKKEPVSEGVKEVEKNPEAQKKPEKVVKPEQGKASEYFDLTAECLSIVASDGHKLVRNKIMSIQGQQPAAFILPKKPASLLKNLLGKDGGNVTIRFDERNAQINYGEGELICRLIEGRYPNRTNI